MTGSLTSPSPESFYDLERSRTRALVARRVDVARELHAPDYQLINPLGELWDLERYLGAIEAGTLIYSSWRIDAIAARVSSALSVVRSEVRLEFPFAGWRPVDCWHLDTYELRDGAWKAVWSQATAKSAAR